MNLTKLVLIAIGILIAALLGYSLIGIVYSALWYLFWIGAVAVAGTVTYKLLRKPDAARIENREPIVISEFRDVDRALEEYKRKSLSE